MYQDLLSRGYRFEQNSSFSTTMLRGWLENVGEYQKQSKVELELFRLWGLGLKQLLGHTQPENFRKDSLLVSQYLSNVCSLNAAELVHGSSPKKSPAPRHLTAWHWDSIWSQKPLFIQTREIMLLLGAKAKFGPVLHNIVSSRSVSVDRLLDLMNESDKLVFSTGVTSSNFLQTGRAAVLSWIPDLLCHSIWSPATDKIDSYGLAWFFAASIKEKTIERIAACKHAFSTNVSHQLYFLVAHPNLEPCEVQALFPLSEPGLLKPVGVHYLVHVFVHRNESSAWQSSVEEFKKHHAELAELVELHLSIFPDGKPLELLETSLRQKINGNRMSEPDILSIEDLGL